MDKKNWFQRLLIAIWPYPEIARLKEKCRERSNDAYAWQLKHDALQEQIKQAQREYHTVRGDVPARILEGKNPEAVHQARREYENNLLRVFVNKAFRVSQELQNEVVKINKDLDRGKTAVLGGMTAGGQQEDPPPLV